MNTFRIDKVIAACDHWLLTGNRIQDRVTYLHVYNLKAYAAALASDGRELVHLTIEDLGMVAPIYAQVVIPRP